MSKLIVGLGNPGREYENTRHNAGFMLLDFIAEKSWEKQGKLNADVSNIQIDGQRLVLLKPMTYMNSSGTAVKAAAKWFEIDPVKDLLVVHDDLDLRLGSFKLQYARSPKDHNGLISIERHLGTNQFWRLRIGVDNRGNFREPGIDYVLKRFKSDEMKTLESEFGRMKDAIMDKFVNLS